MKNAYPEKPALPYMRTSVEMGDVVAYLKGLKVPTEVKRAAYIFFRFESANGTKGVNNNFTGAQCDGGRWPSEYDRLITGTVIKQENGTGKVRIFPAFGRWQDSLYFTVTNAQRRGLFVGGTTFRVVKMDVENARDLCIAYKREWVKGDKDYMPSEAEITPFLNTYAKAVEIFPQ
nr:hypothetical protein [uncultured Chitinophaga sp.]